MRRLRLLERIENACAELTGDGRGKLHVYVRPEVFPRLVREAIQGCDFQLVLHSDSRVPRGSFFVLEPEDAEALGAYRSPATTWRCSACGSLHSGGQSLPFACAQGREEWQQDARSWREIG